jgi:S-adenosylmethionine/arginine decarboxylase-like enzyme
MHLVIDGYGGDIDKMWDEDLVRDFLYDYPDSLDMTRISEPNVLRYEAPKSEDSGVSGFVIIAESHISIPFPARTISTSTSFPASLSTTNGRWKTLKSYSA